MHLHHKIPKSRGGTDEDWNLTEISDYDHAYGHALDFVIFEKAPAFDFRLNAWPLLPEELRAACLKEKARGTGLMNSTRVGQKRSEKSVAKQRETIKREHHL